MINKSPIIQIEVCSHCLNSCSHCTRAIPLLKERKYHSLDYIEKALLSLAGTRNIVGCFGGEPTLHPRFHDICFLFQKYFPKKRCGLWSSGGESFRKHQKIIHETFGIINYNEDKKSSWHTPPLLSLSDFIPDSKEREKLIRRCWVHHLWSAIITPEGAFFCEVASTIARIKGQKSGVTISPGWINNKKLLAQRDSCHKCGIPLASPSFLASENVNYVSSEYHSNFDHPNLILMKKLEDLPRTQESAWNYSKGNKAFHFKSTLLWKIRYHLLLLRYRIIRIFL